MTKPQRTFLAAVVFSIAAMMIVATYWAYVSYVPARASTEQASGDDFVKLYTQYDQSEGEFTVWKHAPTGACFVRFYDYRGVGITSVHNGVCSIYEKR